MVYKFLEVFLIKVSKWQLGMITPKIKLENMLLLLNWVKPVIFCESVSALKLLWFYHICKRTSWLWNLSLLPVWTCLSTVSLLFVTLIMSYLNFLFLFYASFCFNSMLILLFFAKRKQQETRKIVYKALRICLILYAVHCLWSIKCNKLKMVQVYNMWFPVALFW